MAAGNNKLKKQIVMPEDIYERIQAFAAREDRSIGNAVVRLLRLGLEQDLDLTGYRDKYSDDDRPGREP
jgi:hypothetical protein